MSKRMLVDGTHPEETRVVVLSGNKLDEFDFETSTKTQLKGNIYLAKVTRVEPSLQAAFVEYGGNRHGFLAFNEIHPDYYQIPVADREALLAEEARLQAKANAAEAAREDAGDDEPHDDHDHDRDHDHRDDDRQDEAQAAHDDAPGYDGSQYAPEAADVEEPAEAPDAAHDPTAESSAPQESAALEAQPYAEVASEPVEASDADHAAENGNGEAPAANIAEVAVPEHRVETIGGDETEEAVERRRVRPLRHYKIQEVIKRRQILLVQVVKEERGNKGAALTTYLSLAGRYCVLMPNTARGGGISRKIASQADRRKLRKTLGELEIPEGMGVIMRTAGVERSKAEIKRDLDFLLRAWDDVRELTLKSTAPALVYEEGNLIKRAIRDLYAKDIDEIQVEGDQAYQIAKTFMRMLMPSHAKKVQHYNDPSMPLFYRYQVEGQLAQMHSPVVQLKSGGYIVINPTEALVAIDVNSGRATRERNIEETATKTNLEAADEVARQLRLRDLAGLIVIDFIDMEDGRNQRNVERRLKEAMKSDRARLQVGRISPFGLLELSRQRLRPSLQEASTEICPRCRGAGHVRSTESTAVHVLRAIEEEGIRHRTEKVSVAVPTEVALYILNQKRGLLNGIEHRYDFSVEVTGDETLIPPDFRLERVKARTTPFEAPVVAPAPTPFVEGDDEIVEEIEDEVEEHEEEHAEAAEAQEHQPRHDQGQQQPQDGERRDGGRRRRRRRRRGRGGGDGERRPDQHQPQFQPSPAGNGDDNGDFQPQETEAEERQPDYFTEQPYESQLRGDGQGGNGEQRGGRRRRGRRGGRRRGQGEQRGSGGVRVFDETQGTVPTASEIAWSSGQPDAQPEPLPEPMPAPSRPQPDEIAWATGQPDARPVPAREPPPEPPVHPQPDEVAWSSGQPTAEPAPAAEPEPSAEPKPARRGWWQRVRG